MSSESSNVPASSEKFTHPHGLYTLFFTEMWERFSYYGMRALLILFMAEQIGKGGLGMDEKTAGAIYGLYVGAVYLAALPGGWLADRIFGAQRAVFIGGCIIALGHFTLAVHGMTAFFLGLIFVVAGTGLLKPNVSAIVGGLYPEGGGRRDAGFTIYYMGINLGAAIGPLVCGWLAKRYGWHYGFAAAGVGMVAGLIQYQMMRKLLGDAGRLPGSSEELPGRHKTILAGIAALALATIGSCFAGIIKLNPAALAESFTYVIVGIGVVYFISVFMFAKLDATEKKRMGVLIVLLISSAIFFAGFEQAGSSLNLFAERNTERRVSFISWEIPAAWFQSLNPVFILTLAPVLASAWVSPWTQAIEPGCAGEICDGFDFSCSGIRCDGAGGGVRCQRTKSWTALADAHISTTHDW